MTADAAAVMAVVVARDLVDLGAPDYRLEDLREEWGASEFNLEHDAIVAEDDDGRIVAYAAVRTPGALAVVSPDDEGRGIGTQLLGWAQQRDRELHRDKHLQRIAATNTRARALLQAAGYGLVRSYWRMVCPLEQLVPASPPSGFRLRALDVERDAEAVHALDAASFFPNADYRPVSLPQFREEHLEAHDLDTGLSLVAQDGDRIAGFLLSRRWTPEAVGFVDILAVHPDYQRRGLGAELLSGAFDRFRAAGLREAQLGVASDNPRAQRLYDRLGMAARFQFDTYERPISTVPR